MATSSGTASNHADLLSRLVTFLTTGLGGSNWALLASNTTPYSYTNPSTAVVETIDAEYYLEAPGLSGSETIYINLQAFHNTGLDIYNIRMRGSTGYNSGHNFFNQPGTSPSAFVHLWNSSTPYTFFANGQRAIIVAQVSTVYETAYLGKLLPYGSPGQYPYPLAIGGTSISDDMRFSDTSNNHAAFFDPIGMFVYHVDGTWQQAQNTNSAGTLQHALNVWPWSFGPAASETQPTVIGPNLDGTYPLFPARLEMTSPAANILGELDGVFFTSGTAQSSGSTITVGAATYLVVQNAFRTAANNYAAILEA